jgi:plasmid stability protein
VVRTARLNTYLPDPEVRRRVKVAAARRDLSVSEYCVRAILRQLAEDGEWPPEGTEGMPATEAWEEQDSHEVRS